MIDGENELPVEPGRTGRDTARGHPRKSEHVAVEDGVIIAIEIPSGAVAAGPFDVEVEPLTQALTRVLAAPADSSIVVH